MLLIPGKQYPIAKENAALQVHECGIYQIDRFDASGKLAAVEYWANENGERVSKGVVFAKEGPAQIN